MFASADVALQRIFDKRRGPWVYIAKTSAFSYVLAMSVIGVALLSGIARAPPFDDVPFGTRVLDALIIPPLLENLVLIGFAEFFLALECKPRTIVVAIALLSACAHGIVGEWRAVSGLVLFATMTYTYLLWYESRFSKRFFITVLQHVLFNAPAVFVLGLVETFG